MVKKLYVGNLNFAMTDEDLEQAFAEFGEIISATIVRDRVSGRSRGFGFVEFANADDARKAKEELNGKPVQGRALRIDEAKDQRRSERNRFDG